MRRQTTTSVHPIVRPHRVASYACKSDSVLNLILVDNRNLGIGEPAAGSRYGGRRGSPFLFLCFTQDGSDHLVVLSAVKCKTHGLRFFPPATLELIEHDVLLGLRHTAVAVTATVFATIAYCHNMDAVLPWRAMWGEVRQIVFNEPVRYPVPTVI